MLELVQSGRTRVVPLGEFELTAQAIWNGCVNPNVMLAAAMMGFRRRSGPSWPVCAVKTAPLRQKREILATPAAWFARETGTIASGSSGS
jgi:hypothetical protein